MSAGMEIFAARLASFDTVLYASKDRTSSVRSGKSIAWPHSRPSPAELAHAGFYYNPYETNPDNTTCFLCKRALDGWEEDDNPITEHLKHSSNCGWAIIMNVQQQTSNPAEIEDPTSARIVEARKATFGAMWPHDGKKGWVCQSDKMVEAGWYFCPNDESPDLASCAYCKLSLDGWEPKDDPLEEHYRRSSDCSFFVFAEIPGKGKKKSTRSKKSRVSRTSRLSTQSSMTAASEATMLDHDETMDMSHLSQSTVKSKSTKRGTKSKSKTSKTKKDDPVESSSHADADSLAESQNIVPPKPARATRGRKRTSNEISQDNPSVIIAEDTEAESQPAAKRRATQIRRSGSIMTKESVVEMPLPELAADNDAVTEPEVKKTRRTTKKGRSSKASKSANARASKASTRAQIADESELEIAHAGTGMMHEDTVTPVDEPLEKSAPKSRKRSKMASAGPVRPSAETLNGLKQEDDGYQGSDKNHQEASNVTSEMAPKTTSKRKTANKKSKKDIEIELPTQVMDHTSHPEEENDATNFRRSQSHGSFISVEIPVKPLEEHKTDSGDIPSEVAQKPGRKKAASSKGKKVKKASKAKQQPSAVADSELTAEETEVHPSDDYIDNTTTQADERTMHQPVIEQSKAPAKTTERFSDIAQREHRAQSLLASFAEEAEQPHVGETATPMRRAVTKAQESTPSPSPQSSDAENQPPSSRPSAIRPPLRSPSKGQITRIPLTASTPKQSPSRRQEQSGYLTTSKIWTPIDLGYILESSADNKENLNIFGSADQLKELLTSPEKRMTVEEWVLWQAKNGEEKLKQECERLVTLFEKEGGRAMRVLEGIECIE